MEFDQAALHDHLNSTSSYLLVKDLTACLSEHCVRI